jgi:hypothetical protein
MFKEYESGGALDNQFVVFMAMTEHNKDTVAFVVPADNEKRIWLNAEYVTEVNQDHMARLLMHEVSHMGAVETFDNQRARLTTTQDFWYYQDKAIGKDLLSDIGRENIAEVLQHPETYLWGALGGAMTYTGRDLPGGKDELRNLMTDPEKRRSMTLANADSLAYIAFVLGGQRSEGDRHDSAR